MIGNENNKGKIKGEVKEMKITKGKWKGSEGIKIMKEMRKEVKGNEDNKGGVKKNKNNEGEVKWK